MTAMASLQDLIKLQAKSAGQKWIPWPAYRFDLICTLKLSVSKDLPREAASQRTDGCGFDSKTWVRAAIPLSSARLGQAVRSVALDRAGQIWPQWSRTRSCALQGAQRMTGDHLHAFWLWRPFARLTCKVSKDLINVGQGLGSGNA